MALFKEVKCGRCDRRYSALRSKCPHCGARKNRDGKDASAGKGSAAQVAGYAVVLLAVIAAVIVLVCTSLKDKEPEQPGKPSPSPSDPGGVSTVVGTDPTPERTPEPTPEVTPEPTPTPTPEPVVNSITLSREDFTLSKIGETYTITATISPAGSDAALIWISEDPGVATVDENGTVTAVDRGRTIVSAMAGGVISECIVRVNADAPHTGTDPETGASVGDLSLSHKDVTISSATGETFTLSVRNLPADAAVSYSSDNASAATVDSNGVVKAIGKGTANITVSVTVGSDTQTMKCIVRVR